MKHLIRIGTFLVPVFSLIVFQNCHHSFKSDISHASQYKGSAWTAGQIEGGGDPYEGKLYVTKGNSCGGADPFTSRISLINHEVAYLMKFNCALINPPQLITYPQFTVSGALDEVYYSSLVYYSESSSASGFQNTQPTPTPAPSATPAPTPRQVQLTLGSNSCGGGTGYCNCVKSGSPGVPDPSVAQLFCEQMGYSKFIDFATAPGVRGVITCNSYLSASGCFVNQNPGNLNCVSLTCQ